MSDNLFFGNTREIIFKQMSAWSLEGSISDDDDVSPGGCFYCDAAAQISSALIKGSFPISFTSSEAPVAYTYLASIHRKLTVLLYLESRKISSMGDTDPTRGTWGEIRRRLKSIESGEPFGELTPAKGSVSAGSFYCEDLFYGGTSCNRSL